jgi:primary-amine oxidase
MRTFLLALLVVFGLVGTLSAQEAPPSIRVSHPLDALTTDEVGNVAKLLRAGGYAGEDALFGAITLLEPPKADVLAWKTGQPIKRAALAIIREKGKTREARIDLTGNKVVSVEERPGKHPMVMDRNWLRARDAFMADKRFKSAMEKRGIAKLDDVFCTPNSAGNFPGEDFGDRHVVKIPCYSRTNKLHPAVPRSIEGLVGVVDAETGEVLAVLDYATVPHPPPPPGYGDDTPKNDTPLKPVRLIADKGGNIKVTDNIEIGWHRWSLHARPDKRAGLILSLVRFKDADQDRLMAYQLNISEMFVPYMDPDANWIYRTFMDAGEFGLGYLLSSLKPGIDCPENAKFLDLTFPNDVGGTFTRPNGLCLFERANGDPAWRHYSSGRKSVTGVPQVELVVRHIPTLGNYDYVIDYVFSPQGNIQLRVGSTGFDATRSVVSKNMEDPTAASDTAYGNMIAPYTVAPFHDHYFNFRLDLDVDGQKNTLLRDMFVSGAAQNAGPRKSLWTLSTKRYLKEGPIVAPHEAGGTGPLRISNAGVKNLHKQSPSLWLQAHHDAQSILDPADPPQARAGFSAHQFWVTQHKADELWAAGLYPNLSQVDDGLPRFVADAATIVDEDLVLWYTMGFRHVTRPEDFPILPTFWHEMTIRPVFFFDRDPSMTFNPGYPKPGN